MKQVWQVVLIIIGLLAGSVLRSWYAESASEQTASTVPEKTRVETRLVEIDNSGSARAMEALGARLATLEARVLDAGASHERAGETLTLAADRRSGIDQESIQRANAELRASFESVKDAFAREATDPGWAPMQRSKISDKIHERIAAKRVSLLASDVTCKTSICIAKLSWPNFQTAQRELMEADIPDEHCTRRMLLPSEPVPEGEFSAELIFECER